MACFVRGVTRTRCCKNQIPQVIVLKSCRLAIYQLQPHTYPINFNMNLPWEIQCSEFRNYFWLNADRNIDLYRFCSFLFGVPVTGVKYVINENVRLIKHQWKENRKRTNFENLDFYYFLEICNRSQKSWQNKKVNSVFKTSGTAAQRLNTIHLMETLKSISRDDWLFSFSFVFQGDFFFFHFLVFTVHFFSAFSGEPSLFVHPPIFEHLLFSYFFLLSDFLLFFHQLTPFTIFPSQPFRF